ncbi:MAG: DUF2855 family protein [Candidatus Binatia bacterium]
MEPDRPLDFLVRRKNLAECRFVPAPAPESLAPGEVLVAVDRFALTANNVTYAVAGDMMSYWSFFPAEEGWGRVPVWGFGDVVRSKHEAVPEGERLFGYFPMSSWLLIRPGAVGPASVVDASAHRQGLPPIYNQYSRIGADRLYDRDTEDRQMLFRPLFLTAFLLDDFLAESDLFGASAVLLTSASSKTSIGLASLLSASRRAPGGVIGLTSARNAAFVEGLGCYDRFVRYEDVRAIPADTSVAIVDMAGDAELLTTLHRHFGEGVKLSCLVGLTHHDRMGQPHGLPGAPPTFFFAPDRARKRAADWGGEALQERTAKAWREFLKVSKDWIRVVRGDGPEAVEKVYRATLAGRVSPAEGHVLSLR